MQHSHLRRAYFNFILSICGAGLQEVFYSESASAVLLLRLEPPRNNDADGTRAPAENKAHLPSILQSITHYISHDALAPDQRYGFGVLNKLLALWVEPYRAPTAPAPVPAPPPSPVPGFERFLYEEGVKVCFEVPLQADFDYSDAQSFQVRRALPSLEVRAAFARAPPSFEAGELDADAHTPSRAPAGHRRDRDVPQGAPAEAQQRVCRLYDEPVPAGHLVPARGERPVHDGAAGRSRVRRPVSPSLSLSLVGVHTRM